MSLSTCGSCPDLKEDREGIMIRFLRSTTLRETEIETVGDQIFTVAQKRRPGTLLLDFAGVQFLSAAVLGKLVSLHARLRQLGTRLVLTSLSAELFELFEITQLQTILDIRQTGPWDEFAGQLSA
jgi:anti-anti-sigma factor